MRSIARRIATRPPVAYALRTELWNTQRISSNLRTRKCDCGDWSSRLLSEAAGNLIESAHLQLSGGRICDYASKANQPSTTSIPVFRGGSATLDSIQHHCWLCHNGKKIGRASCRERV